MNETMMVKGKMPKIEKLNTNRRENIDLLAESLDKFIKRVVNLIASHGLQLDYSWSDQERADLDYEVTILKRYGKWAMWYKQPDENKKEVYALRDMCNDAPLAVRISFMLQAEDFVSRLVEMLGEFPDRIKTAIDAGDRALKMLDELYCEENNS